MKNEGLVVPGPHLRTEMRLKNKNENEWRMNTKEVTKELDEKLPDALFQLGISKPYHGQQGCRQSTVDYETVDGLKVYCGLSTALWTVLWFGDP